MKAPGANHTTMSEPFTHYETTLEGKTVFVYKPPRRNRKRELLSALQAGERLSGKHIWMRFGIYRASEIIRQLRAEGHAIECHMEQMPDGRRYGVYFMKNIL